MRSAHETQSFSFCVWITGLPRSGSTLLAAILRQNPRFHAGMTSPAGSLFRDMLNQLGAGSEFGPVVSTQHVCHCAQRDHRTSRSSPSRPFSFLQIMRWRKAVRMSSL